MGSLLWVSYSSSLALVVLVLAHQRWLVRLLAGCRLDFANPVLPKHLPALVWFDRRIHRLRLPAQVAVLPANRGSLVCSSIAHLLLRRVASSSLVARLRIVVPVLLAPRRGCVGATDAIALQISISIRLNLVG